MFFNCSVNESKTPAILRTLHYRTHLMYCICGIFPMYFLSQISHITAYFTGAGIALQGLITQVTYLANNPSRWMVTQAIGIVQGHFKYMVSQHCRKFSFLTQKWT